MFFQSFLWGFLTLVVAADASAINGHRSLRRRDGPVAPDTIKDCTYFYNAKSGDTCASIANDWGITAQQFLAYNPSVKSDCSGLIIGNSYCIEENFGHGPARPSTTSTTIPPTSASLPTSIRTATTSTASAGPRPTQASITSQCTQYYKARAGDTCSGIVNSYHTFTLQDFYSWNPAVGSNCETLFVGYYVCVGVPGTPTTQTFSTPTATSTTSSGPSPTQFGIALDCTKYYKAVSGDSCTVIADQFGTFTVSDFQGWNPAVKPDCSLLFLGYYYCIAVPGTPATRPSTPAPGPASTGPQPQQPGIVSNCNKYYLVKSGDGCYVIEQNEDISSQQFLQWNTGIASDCSNLFLGYYVCIGAS